MCGYAVTGNYNALQGMIITDEPWHKEPKPGVAGQHKRNGSRHLPSYQELADYVLSRGLSQLDADWLWNKWQGTQWKVGGKPIGSWTHTIIQWQLRGDIFPGQKQAQTQTTPKQMSAWDIKQRKEAVLQAMNDEYRKNGKSPEHERLKGKLRDLEGMLLL